MSPFLPVSIGALLAASLWGIVLAGRRGDPYRRLLAFVISTLAMAHASWLVGLAVAPDPQGWIAELAPPIIGVLAILALFLLGRISARQRHVEQRLEVQKAYLEDLLESSTDAIVLVNREARVLRVNSAFTELFGFGSREVVGEALDEMVTFPDQLRWARAVTRRMVAGEPMEVESIRRRKDGTAIDVSVVAYPVRVPGDEAAAFVIFRDISRRVQVEAAFRRLEKAVETMQIGVTITDLDGRIVYINPAEAEMHGYAREELIGRDVRIFAVAGTAKRMTPEQIARMGTWRRESVNVRKDGTSYPVQLMSDVVLNADSKPIGIVTTCEDITLRRAAERALRESEERYALAVRGANDGVWDWNLDTGEVYYSTAWKAILGHGDDEIGNTLSEWLSRVHPEDLARVQAELEAARPDGSPRFEIEHRVFHKDGTVRWVLARGIAERRPDGTPNRLVGSLTDITARKGVEEQLTQDALYDSLTGLPNRAFLTDLLHRAHQRMKRRRGYQFAVLFVDLDRFKTVNDSMGHVAGDRLLIGASRRLQKCLRPGDVIARISGDEFCILLDDIKDSSDASRVAQRIQDSLRPPLRVDGRDIVTTASIGIAVSDPSLEEPEQLIRNADSAMYRAKSAGRARFELYDLKMQQRALALLRMETELREAMEAGHIRLVYQPVVSLETQTVESFEALLRWDHPERGPVPADLFIPLAEETGLIVTIGRWALRQACTQMADWVRRFPTHDDLTISVNLSAKQLKQPDIIEQIVAALEDSGLDSRRLRLEIPERVLTEDADTIRPAIERLRQLSVQVQVDDFGTGASSLNYLTRLPVETVKIDRSFIRDMGGPGERSAVVQAFITLARHLGLRVVAEGVETREQMVTLAGLNCEQAQGFLYSRPLEATEASSLLEGELLRLAWQ